ncbi:MAG: hypothetical protein U0984_07955 [Prosthecobacter sp.]|nr:hypothetical protein [Prosthecobacter sp.]
MKTAFLVLVLFLAGRGGWAAAVSVGAEAEECFEWFGTLGFPEVKEAVFAEVRITYGRRNAEGGQESYTFYGYVTPRPNKRFFVLDVNLVQGELPGDDPAAAKMFLPVRYAERSFVDYARGQMEALRTAPKEYRSRFGALLDQKAEVFFLAYACWRKGEIALAGGLFEEAQKLEIQRFANDAGERTMRQEIERQISHQAMWDAVVRFGGKGFSRRPYALYAALRELAPRTELLEHFRHFVRLYPGSAHLERAKKTVAMLEKMVAEDAAHPAITDEELAKLPVEAQVREWIFRLRDTHAIHQMSEGVSILWPEPAGVDRKRSAAHRLADIGYPAVPQLIEALVDERFSRSVRCRRSFYFSHEVLTVGDCALQILDQIAGRTFRRGDTAEASRAGVREWWGKFQHQGERESLIETIEAGTDDPRPLVTKLQKKYPEVVEKAVLAGAAKAASDWRLIQYLELAGDLQTDAAGVFLLREANAGKTVMIRAAALRQLWKGDSKEVVPLLVEEWRRFPKEAEAQRANGFDDLVELLCITGDARAIGALAEDWEGRVAGQRFHIVSRLGVFMRPREKSDWLSDLKAKAPELSAKESAIELLVRALEDTKIEYLSGSSGDGYSYSCPRICEFALRSLSQITPPTYAFSTKAGRFRRDVERITAANVWRKTHGKPLLPVPQRNLPELPPEQALKITTVAVIPTRAGSPAEAQATALKGKLLTPVSITELMRAVASGRMEGVCGLEIEATRDDDLRGVALTIREVAGEFPRGEQADYDIRWMVAVDEKETHGTSQSGQLGSGLNAAYWAKEEKDLEAALPARPEALLRIRAEIMVKGK